MENSSAERNDQESRLRAVVSEPSDAESAPSSEQSDNDSATGDSFISSTASIDSEIYDHVREHGRTYHRYKQGRYHLPNDPDEQERLDLQHTIFLKTTHGKLHLAPLDTRMQRCLDIGTGIWAIEFAELFPGAEVIGTDLSPIQPGLVPPNCQFQIDDADDPWTFKVPFDYIHARALCICFPDHKSVIRKCFNALSPGGWCEWQDVVFPFAFFGTVRKCTSFLRWAELLREAAEKIRRPWTSASNYKRYFEEVGFINVTEQRYVWPLGDWAKGEYYKEIGRNFREDVKRAMEPISLKLLSVLGWTDAEIQVLLAQVRSDLMDPDIHAYLEVTFVYGQKAPIPTSPPLPNVSASSLHDN